MFPEQCRQRIIWTVHGQNYRLHTIIVWVLSQYYWLYKYFWVYRIKFESTELMHSLCIGTIDYGPECTSIRGTRVRHDSHFLANDPSIILTAYDMPHTKCDCPNIDHSFWLHRPQWLAIRDPSNEWYAIYCGGFSFACFEILCFNYTIILHVRKMTHLESDSHVTFHIMCCVIKLAIIVRHWTRWKQSWITFDLWKPRI